MWIVTWCGVFLPPPPLPPLLLLLLVNAASHLNFKLDICNLACAQFLHFTDVRRIFHRVSTSANELLLALRPFASHFLNWFCHIPCVYLRCQLVAVLVVIVTFLLWCDDKWRLFVWAKLNDIFFASIRNCTSQTELRWFLIWNAIEFWFESGRCAFLFLCPFDIYIFHEWMSYSCLKLSARWSTSKFFFIIFVFGIFNEIVWFRFL